MHSSLESQLLLQKVPLYASSEPANIINTADNNLSGAAAWCAAGAVPDAAA